MLNAPFDTLAWLNGLPLWYQLVVVGILGAVLASFLNVVAYRLHTNATLSGRSRCFSCGRVLAWYELVPIVSFLVLAGRCGGCHARVPARYVIVELVLAAGFACVYLNSTSLGEFAFMATLLCVLLVIVLYDLTHYIIPDELVLVTFGLTLLGALLNTWPPTAASALNLALVTLTASGGYALLWAVSRGRWLGLGDVKLVAALAPALSTFPQAFSMVVLSFWTGTVVVLLVVCLPALIERFRHPKALHRPGLLGREIPFAPFIVVAFLVVYVYDVSVLSFFTW